MSNRKWIKLLTVLVIAAVLTIAATQRFDTIIAKKIVVTGSGGFELGDGSGSFDLNGKELTLDADDDSSFTADTDDQLDLELGGQDEFVFTASVFDLGEGTLTRIDLDADGDTSVRSSADDQINLEIGGSDIYSMTATNLHVNGKILDLDADQDTSLTASTDDQIDVELGGTDEFTFTTSALLVGVNDLKVGVGTPSFTQDGSDAYIEGTVEMASDVIVGARSSFSVVFNVPITPTGIYQPLVTDAGGAAEADNSNVAAPTDDTTGKLLILHNIDATDVITIDGTGADVECKADIALGLEDTLTLIWNGDDWNCIANYDNS